MSEIMAKKINQFFDNIASFVASPERAKISTVAMKAAGITLAGATAADLLIRTKRNDRKNSQVRIQTTQLKQKQDNAKRRREQFVNSQEYYNLVQDQYNNRTGHYKMGNSKFQ